MMLPSLEKLSLRCCTAENEVHFSTPRLTSLCLYVDNVVSLRLRNLAVSWAALTEVNILCGSMEVLYLDDLLDVLRQTNNLSTLRFNPGIDCRVPSDTSPPLCLPHLRILAIQDQCNTFLYSHSLAYFQTPLLEQLDYYIGYSPRATHQADPTASIREFLPSLPSLKLFRLGLLQDEFFHGVFPLTHWPFATSLKHSFYVIYPSPPSAFASLGEDMFISPIDTPRNVALRLLAHPLVQLRRPIPGFWPEGGDMSDIFGTVLCKTDLVPRVTTVVEENLVEDTTMGFTPYIDLLRSDTYRGERAFLIQYSC
jgi:hypothetical protein